MNWLFGFSLSGTTDVYKVYRKISCILQKINILPHEKYDCFKHYLTTFSNMLKTISLENCPCLLIDSEDVFWRGVTEEVCLWPRLHEDVRNALELGTYRGINLGLMRQEEWRTRGGSQVNLQWLDMDVEGVVVKVQQRMEQLVMFLREGLEEKVYTKTEVKYIENCRKLLDLKSHSAKVHHHGAVRISGLHYKSFRSAALFLEPNMDTRIDPDELRIQWRSYNEVLEGMTKLEEQNSLEILSTLVDPKKNLCRGIENILSILVRAAVAMGGVEAVVESMVSVVEAHTPPSRSILNQERLENEVIVAWNGEDTFHCDPVVRESLASYWSSSKILGNRDGHFIRRSQNINSYIVSEAVDNYLKKPAKLGVMME